MSLNLIAYEYNSEEEVDSDEGKDGLPQQNGKSQIDESEKVQEKFKEQKITAQPKTVKKLTRPRQRKLKTTDSKTCPRPNVKRVNKKQAKNVAPDLLSQWPFKHCKIVVNLSDQQRSQDGHWNVEKDDLVFHDVLTELEKDEILKDAPQLLANLSEPPPPSPTLQGDGLKPIGTIPLDLNLVKIEKPNPKIKIVKKPKKVIKAFKCPFCFLIFVECELFKSHLKIHPRPVKKKEISGDGAEPKAPPIESEAIGNDDKTPKVKPTVLPRPRPGPACSKLNIRLPIIRLDKIKIPIPSPENLKKTETGSKSKPEKATKNSALKRRIVECEIETEKKSKKDIKQKITDKENKAMRPILNKLFLKQAQPKTKGLTTIKDKSSWTLKAADAISKCSECNLTFNSRWDHRLHNLNHEVKQKRYSCEECEKTFQFTWSLKQHASLHKRQVRFAQ